MFDNANVIIVITGEGNAVAVNILMVNMLEEMNASEQLWASHTGGSKLSTIVYRYEMACFLPGWL